MLDFKSFKDAMQSSSIAERLGIDNTIPSDLSDNLSFLYQHYCNLVTYFLEGIGSIYITSGYRCTRLNKAVGGVSNSNHTKCRAFDFAFRGVASKSEFLKRFEELKRLYIHFHISKFGFSLKAASLLFNRHFIVYPERLFVHYQVNTTD